MVLTHRALTRRIDYDKYGDCPWKAEIDHAKATQL